MTRWIYATGLRNTNLKEQADEQTAQSVETLLVQIQLPTCRARSLLETVALASGHKPQPVWSDHESHIETLHSLLADWQR